MAKIVLMVVACWVPENGALNEVWRIEKDVTIDHCLTMNRVFSGGGRAAAITVRCEAK